MVFAKYNASAADGSNAGDRPLSPEDFIHPDHVKMATGNPTMFILDDTGDVKEVIISEDIRGMGVLPPGYSIGE